MAVPAAAVAGPVQISVSTTNPGIPQLMLHARSTAHARADQTQLDTPLLYITLTATSSVVTFTGGFPGFTIALPPSAGTGPFYLAQLENNLWTTIAGPVSLSSGSVTLQPNLSALSIPADSSVYFVLYTGGVVPSTAPTSSPGGAPTASGSPVTSPTPTGTGATSSPNPSPTASSTLAPTATPSATSSPTSFPTSSPTAPPTTSPSGTQPASFVMGTPYPTVNWGDTSLSDQPISNFKVLDAAGNPITGTFSQSVTVASNSSVVTLSVLGGASGQSVTLTSGSQIVALSYNGAATNPVTISASASGATPNSAVFTPAAQPISYSGPTVSGSPEIDLYAPQGEGTGSTFSFTATQAGYTGSFGNTLSLNVPSACNSFATVTQSGTSFTVNAIASPVAGSCTITLGGFGTTTLNVTITYTTFGVILQ